MGVRPSLGSRSVRPIVVSFGCRLGLSVERETRWPSVPVVDPSIALVGCRRWTRLYGAHGSYLVDPASSHMLVSKIKPCMSKHKPLHGEAANGSLGHP